MSDHPRPAPDGPAEPFWQAARDHRLVVQRCRDCGAWRWPPRPVCAQCRSAATTWEEVSGRATVHTFTIVHPPVLPAYADRVPYNAAVVQLEEGPFLVSNLLDVANEDVEIGMSVVVAFRDVDDGLTLPQFRPAPPT